MNNYGFLKSLSSWAVEQSIPLVLLRPQFIEQDFITSDLDVLIKKDHIHHISEWIRNQSIKIISIHKRNDGITYYLQAVGLSLHIDFFYKLAVKGQEYLTPEMVIQRAVQIENIFYPDSVDQAVILLMTHGLKHKSINQQKKYAAFIKETIKHNRDSFHEIIIQFFGNSSGQTIFEELREQGYSTSVASSNSSFCASIWKTYGLAFVYTYLEYYFQEVILRITMPKYTIIFLGVDGSGKTTLIKSVLKALQPHFSDRRYFHLLPKFSENKSSDFQGQNSNPHQKPYRSLFASVIKTVLYCLKYHLMQFYPAKKPMICLYDRHLCDMLADPKRFRVNPSHLRFLSHVIHWAPKPDIAIILNISATAAQNRKQEVPFIETERQVIAYKNLAQHIDHAILINAEMNAEAVSAIAIQHIFDCLNKKTADNV